MIPFDSLVLLDTNVVVHLARDNTLGRRINEDYQLSERRVRPLISIVTVGELFAFARKRGWGDRKVEKLKDIVRGLTVADIRPQNVIDRYAEIDAYSERQGQTMGDNDVWIAATAAAAGAHLLTTDKDFDHLHPTHVQREWVDPST